MSLDPITAIFDLGKTAIEKFFPDPKAKADALFRLEELKAKGDSERLQAEVQLMLGQIQINQIEAASSDRFVAGWRPYIGWICGTAFGYQFIVEPIMRFIAQVCFGYLGQFPVLKLEELTTILIGILGLGAYRSAEKIQQIRAESGLQK
jgi:hypothetical protein